MSNHELEISLLQIISGKIQAEVNNQSLYIVKPPIESLLRSNEIYDITFNEALDNNFFVEDSILDFMVEHNLWSLDEEKQYTEIDKEIERTKIELYNQYTSFRNCDQVRKILANLKDYKRKLIGKRSIFDIYTAEYIAGSARMFYLLWSGTYCRGKKYFRTKFEHADYYALNKLISSYNNSVLDDGTIRQISQIPQWQIYWSLGGLNIFRKSIFTLTDNQVSLMSWSRFYDNIRKSMDAPSDEIILDDDLLDGWVIINNKKRKEEKAKSFTEKSIMDGSKNADEVFVVTDDQSGISRINSLNDSYGKMVQRQKIALAQKYGEANDFEMPSSKQKIMEEIAKIKPR
jgi:hypothetical protein